MINVILFGASKIFYQCALESFDSRNVKIIGFSDNCSEKQGLIFEQLPIINPTELASIHFDYIIVCAWFSYNEIYNQLINLCIPKEKILPLLNINKLYAITKNFRYNENDVKKLFKNSEIILERLKEIFEVNNKYEMVNSLPSNPPVIDYKHNRIIAHACGGYIDGKKREYTNSIESFEEAIKNNIKVFECDVWAVEGNNIIMGSRIKMQYPIEIFNREFGVLTFDYIVKKINEKKDIKIIFDIKWNAFRDFCFILDEISNRVEEIAKTKNINIKNNIIIEVFDEITAEYAYSQKWKCVLTDYRNPENLFFKKSVLICLKYGIDTIFLDYNTIISNSKYLNIFRDKEISIVSYTVDDIDEYVYARKLGVKSVLSNWLLPIYTNRY